VLYPAHRHLRVGALRGSDPSALCPVPMPEPLTQTPCYEEVCKMCRSADVPTSGVPYSSA
jgi:hypothetical protein